MGNNVIHFRTVHDIKRAHDPDYKRKANAAATLKRLEEENSQDYYVFYLSQHEGHTERAKAKARRMADAAQPVKQTLLKRIIQTMTSGKGVTA